MIAHVRCIASFAGDAFGHGQFEKFEEGRVYALPSVFITANADKFEDIYLRETKPQRQALEIKGNNSTSKRTSKPRRTKAKSQDN